jgi:hypothetical protein
LAIFIYLFDIQSQFALLFQIGPTGRSQKLRILTT